MRSNKFYKTTRLHNDVWAIEDILSSEHSIAYLLRGTNKALLFDTGLGLSPIMPVVKQLTSLPVVACLSHWHFDHSGGAYEFKHIIAWNSANMRTAATEGISNAVIKTEVDQNFWDTLDDTYRTREFPRVQLIDTERSLDIGGYHLQILHTPGHTTDSLCLYEPERQWLFAGDTIYPGPIYLQFDDSSVEKYTVTINRLLGYKIASLFPGHNALQVSADIVGDIDTMLKDKSFRSTTFPNLTISLK